MKKHCKECPWVVKNKHNDSIVNHSKRFNKKHNCHMMVDHVGDTLWSENPKCQCVGNKEYLSTK